MGEEYARQGVSEVMDEVVRNPQSRLRTYVLVAYHDQAQSILKLPYALNRLPSDAIVDMEQQGIAIDIDAKEFTQKLTQWGDPVAMGISKTKTLHAVSNKSSASFVLNRVAIFQKDKLVGWLEGDDVRGFRWIYGETKADDTTVQVPGSKGTISARVMTSNTRRTVTLANGRPELHIKVHAEYDVNQNASDLDLGAPQNIARLRNAIAHDVITQMKRTMDKLQKDFDADSFGFADKLFERYPSVWQQVKNRWRTLYPSLPVVCEADIQIRNSGLTGTQLSKLD